MATRKIDGWWYVDFRVNRTRLRKRSPANTKGAAEAYEILLRNEIAAHGNLDRLDGRKQATARAAVPTFAEFAERFLTTYVDVNNKPSERYAKRSKIRSALLPTFGRMRMDEITAARVEEYKRNLLLRGRCAKTVNNHITILRRMFTLAVEWGVIRSAPVVRFLKTLPPTFSFLSPEDCARLLAGAEPGPWRTMILAALHTGLRVSELLALDWEDVDMERASLRVARAEVHGVLDATKNNRIRHVPLTRDAVTALQLLPRRSGRVFTFNGERITYDAAFWHLHIACQRSGLPEVGWHQLRHTYASHLASRGASLKTIQDLLGHASLTMTLRYAHLSPDSLRAAVALLETPAPIAKTWAAGGQHGGFPCPNVALDIPADISFATQPSKNPAAIAGLLHGAP